MSDNTRVPAAAASRAYADAYKKLNEIAERLRNGGPENVDTLVADFREAMEAYHYCKSRLAAIRAEIDAELDQLRPEAA